MSDTRSDSVFSHLIKAISADRPRDKICSSGMGVCVPIWRMNVDTTC